MATLLKHVIAESGGDFTNLHDAVEHLKSAHSNLVTADVYAELAITGTWANPDTTQIIIANITMDATHYLSIYTSGAARHSGTWSSSAYRLEYTTAANTQAPIYLAASAAQHIRIDGLQVYTILGAYQDCFGIYIADAAASQVAISDCLIKLSAGSSAGGNYGIHHGSGSTGTTNIFNCIIFNCKRGDYTNGGAIVQDGTVNFYNCTFANNGFGIRRTNGTAVAKNCYADCSSGWSGYAYYGTITKTTCASSDASGSTGLQNIAVNTTNFTNVTAGSEDFHLPLGSALIDVGTDTSGDSAPLNFTTDIDGQTRSGTWDVGADEYVAAGGSIIPILMASYRRRRY